MKEVLILDGDGKTRKEYEEIVKEVKPDARIYETADKDEAYVIASKRFIDVFILDISLRPDTGGMDRLGEEFMRSIRAIEKYQFAPIVIVSALSEHKRRMFSTIHCYQFLDKPYDRGKLKSVIERAITYNTRDNSEMRIFFHSDGLYRAVDLYNLLYIESKNNTTTVHTAKETFTIPYKSCRKLLDKLNFEEMTMCGRGVIVNVENIERLDKGKHHIYMKKSDVVLEIGSSIRKRFLEEMKIHRKI